jgi:tetratricopeptide (TPR) repeat protein
VSFGIALDDQATPTDGFGYMSANWLEPSGVSLRENTGLALTIPVVFIIDKDQRIAWRGKPTDAEGVLQKVLAGTWDNAAFVATLKADIKKEQAAETVWQQHPVKLEIDKINGLVENNDLDGALTEIDTLSTMDGTGSRVNPAKEALQLTIALEMFKHDVEGFYTAFEKALTVYSDDAPFLNNLAWLVADPDSKLPDKRWDLAIKAASTAVDLTKRQDEGCLDTLAWAYFGNGDKDKAIATEKEAIEVADDVDRVARQATLAKMQGMGAPSPAPAAN